MLAVILCGGSGTRLWPVSREAMPKPFMKIGGLSLLQRTVFGIHPTLPETGFGYIECEAVPSGVEPQAVRRFVEKPTPEKAAEYLVAGNYLWNSGMFCFTARTMLAALEEHAPMVLAAARSAVESGKDSDNQLRCLSLDASAFRAAPDISIDYAVMEHASGVVVLAGDFGWSDIGSWKAVADEYERDARGNTSSGDVVFADCSNVHVQTEDRLVAAVGLNDVVIVDTPDAVLVCDRHASQKVKDVVNELKRRGHDTHKLHRTVARPWGTYTTLQEGRNFKIKRIEVKPGASLSLQMHHHRSEHWVVVSGTGKVTVADKVVLLAPNESTYVPLGAKHRLENPGQVPLTLIEVQCGDYVGEDDIVRFDDIYGRAPAAEDTPRAG
jgi:mannose-1-phosphate guanylyltransferase / mannose-6-phosphate isomerase